MPITHLEVRRHPVWREEVTAAAQATPPRRVLVLGHAGGIPLLPAVLILALLAALALIAR